MTHTLHEKEERDACASFSCTRCGECCRVAGYVHLSESETEEIAGFLGIEISEFTERYTRLTRTRAGLSLTEQDDGACIFLNEKGECLIESVKPQQCRQFPFVWRYQDVQHICKGWKKDEHRDD